jgi:NAD(P)-dependent dehydrogenase (short-subunit alcohol dehydrogenase family)
MALTLDGKVALVTGSSRGIGKAIALQLAEDGADIVVCARSEQSTEELPGSIGETAEAVRAKGRRCLALKVDVGDVDDLRRAVATTLRQFGRIDILVNNAGVISAGPFLGGEPAVLDDFYRTNVRGPYVLSQLAAEAMARQRAGVIVNISSGAARHPPAPQPGEPPRARPNGSGLVYGMTKAALDRMGSGIAAELFDKSIASFQVYPGFTITERNSRGGRAAQVDASRAERPETTAKAVAFLCRDPMQHTGRIFQSRQVVDENGL